MKTVPSSKIEYQLISSEKKPSTLSFYQDYFIFKLEPNHTPRTIFYKEIDKLYSIQHKGLYYILLTFSSVFFGITFAMYFTEEGTLHNVVTSVCLLVMCIVNLKENTRIIRIRRGALQTEVFKSSKKEEVKEAFTILKSNQILHKYL